MNYSSGASSIKNMLMENNVQNLSIGFNKINDNGMKEVSESLQHDNTLTRLDAEDCGFSVEGMITLSYYINIHIAIASPTIATNYICS